MTTNSFVVNDIVELRVMQRVFREAKFCALADDDEISDSPIVNELFKRLLVLMPSTTVSANQSETFIAALRRLGSEPFKLAANSARHPAHEEETI